MFTYIALCCCFFVPFHIVSKIVILSDNICVYCVQLCIYKVYVLISRCLPTRRTQHWARSRRRRSSITWSTTWSWLATSMYTFNVSMCVIYLQIFTIFVLDSQIRNEDDKRSEMDGRNWPAFSMHWEAATSPIRNGRNAGMTCGIDLCIIIHANVLCYYCIK